MKEKEKEKERKKVHKHNWGGVETTMKSVV